MASNSAARGPLKPRVLALAEHARAQQEAFIAQLSAAEALPNLHA